MLLVILIDGGGGQVCSPPPYGVDSRCTACHTSADMLNHQAFTAIGQRLRSSEQKLDLVEKPPGGRILAIAGA